MDTEGMDGNIVVADPVGASTAELDYQASISGIRKGLESMKQAFIQIGWYLMHIKEKAFYLQDGYSNIYEFAEDKFHLSKSSASRFMNLCGQFSVNHDSPVIDEKYERYSMSQLVEILPMGQEQREKITPDMPVAKIRELKREAKVPEHVNIPAVSEEVKGVSLEQGYRDGQMAWLRDVEKWGLWYEDPNIHARYYKYVFGDGSQLVAVRHRYTCPPYMKEDPERFLEQIKADGDYYGEPVYHMVYSENFWRMFPNECRMEYRKYYSPDAVRTEELLAFLDWLREWEEEEKYWRTVEIDMGHLEKMADKSLSFLTRRYMEFYEKKGYLPRYFNSKSCVERSGDEPARTLLTTSGQFDGAGSIVTFDLWHNIQWVLNNRIIGADAQKNEIAKLIRVADPEEVEFVDGKFSRISDIWEQLVEIAAGGLFTDITTRNEFDDLMDNLMQPVDPDEAACIRLRYKRIRNLQEDMNWVDGMSDKGMQEKEYRKIMQAASLEERKCMEQGFDRVSVWKTAYGFWKGDYKIWKEALEQRGEKSEIGKVRFRVKKLTEAQVFNLMGVSYTEDDIRELKAKGVKSSTLYQVAGEGVPAPMTKAFLEMIKKDG